MSPLKFRYLRPLIARDRNEPHRTATQLELLFDLVVVIAIAASAHGLAHEFSEGHIGRGILQFAIAFFAIWWPWNIFTWFASSFDNDDAAYRLNVMVMMGGVMLVAASIPSVFKGEAQAYAFIGYIILRLASAVLWLRVGGDNPHLKITAKRYAFGQMALQGLWAITVFVPPVGSVASYLLFGFSALCEFLIPWYAEQSEPTPWHRHHIIERFGLLNIIVLGEVLLGSTHAMQEVIQAGFNLPLMGLALCGMTIAFTMWWLYFCEAEHLESIEVKRVFVWGYGHFLIFTSGAATGAGLSLMVEVLTATHQEGGHGSIEVAALAITIPLALYILGLWIVRDRYRINKFYSSLLLFFAVLIAFSAMLPYPPLPATVLAVLCLAIRLRSQ